MEAELERDLEPHRLISVSEISQVGEVRRALDEMVRRFDFDDDYRGRAALVATELATNLVKHSRTGGQIMFGPHLDCDGLPIGLEIISLDHGVGITNVERAMQDGYSTAGSPGTGLGAIKRIAQQMHIYSRPEHGTVIVASLCRKRAPDRPGSRVREVSLLKTAYQEGEVSGDGCRIDSAGQILRIMMVDGLGHGDEAATASRTAAGVYRVTPPGDLVKLFAKIHVALQTTRGAAVGVAEIDFGARRVRYAGIGNVEARIWSEAGVRGCANSNGTVGVAYQKVIVFEYDLPPRATWIMHSDGISGRWRPSLYPGLDFANPRLITGVIFRDFARKRDDVSILALTL